MCKLFHFIDWLIKQKVVYILGGFIYFTIKSWDAFCDKQVDF